MWYRTPRSCPNQNSICLRQIRLRLFAFLLIFAVYLLASFVARFIGIKKTEGPLQGSAVVGIQHESSGRHLLEIIANDNMSSQSSVNVNCTLPAINDFPPDLFTDEQRQHGASLLHAFLAIYLFTLLAIVCDNYFVPAIKKITQVFHISKDVAGATFMAAATSSPELFINSVGTFVTEGDIGIGTIVGSGVFNILAVPACCGLIAGKTLTLDWWPLTRDSIVYGITVILLILTLADDKVSWQEALILVICYLAYILFMCFNEKIEKWVKGCSDGSTTGEAEASQLLPEEFPENSGQILGWSEENTDSESESECSEHEEANAINLWQWPNGKFGKAWWIFTWPISLVLSFTIPDCRKPSIQHLYPITFLMCIFYIGFASYMIAWMITVIGDTARIPDSVMGLTFLAAGTSLPEAVSSVIVANQGYGSMGLSNSIGSNTFDILLCLGLPWLIKSTLAPTVPGEHYVFINSKGIEYSAVILLSSLLILYTSFIWNKFKLNRKVGMICFIVYTIFVIVASLNELNFFYIVNMPICGW